MDEEERLREISFLEYEIKEIEDADLKRARMRHWRLTTGNSPTERRSWRR